MKQYLLIVVVLGWGVVSPACKQRPSGRSVYYAKSRWYTADPDAHRPLKGQPIEITDSVYQEKDAGGMDSTKKFLNYEKWRFDKQGALSYRRLFFTDTFWNETFIRRSDSGERKFMVMHSGNVNKKPDTLMVLTSEDQPDGRFKETTYDPQGQPSHISFISFPSGGDVLKQEFQGATAGGVKFNRVVLNVYEGDRLLKLTEQDFPGDSARADYFYSVRGFLDSIVNRKNGNISRRDIFKNNDQGDPIRQLVLSPMGDTAGDYTWRYEYDQQGNWSKRWERQAGDHYPVTLIIRKFIYPGGDAVAGD